MRFFNLVADRVLEIYLVPQASLKVFTSDKRKYAYTSMPDEQYRVKQEELRASYKSEEETKRASEDQNDENDDEAEDDPNAPCLLDQIEAITAAK